MTKIDHRACFLLITAFLIAAAIKEPQLLDDRNAFLKEFVNHEFLSFIGIITTITLASCANIYSILREKEKAAGIEFLAATKRAIRLSAYSLITLLFLSLAVVTAKGAILPSEGSIGALINSTALILSVFGFSVILDITRLALKI